MVVCRYNCVILYKNSKKTLSKDDYAQIQRKRRTQMNIPTSSNIDKQEHLVIGKTVCGYITYRDMLIYHIHFPVNQI